MPDQEWEVTIKWKHGPDSVYIFVGKREEARLDAYLSTSKGDVQQVIVKPYVRDYY